VKKISQLGIIATITLFSFHSVLPISITVKNGTDSELRSVIATFRFMGENDLAKKSIKGKIIVQNLKAGATATFNSDKAVHHHSIVIDHFKHKPTVNLDDLEADHWKLRMHMWGIGGVKKDFKHDGHYTHYIITAKKGRLGLTHYELEPIKSIFKL
jgi:hypothetical protein